MTTRRIAGFCALCRSRCGCVSVVEDGRLVGDMDGRGKQVLIASSNTEFSGLYGLGVQFTDGGLFVKHVSGNYRFKRR